MTVRERLPPPRQDDTTRPTTRIRNLTNESMVEDPGKVGTTGTPEDCPEGLYKCSDNCAQGRFHEHSGCEACHNPDAPYIVKFPTWETAGAVSICSCDPI